MSLSLSLWGRSTPAVSRTVWRRSIYKCVKSSLAVIAESCDMSCASMMVEFILWKSKCSMGVASLRRWPSCLRCRATSLGWRPTCRRWRAASTEAGWGAGAGPAETRWWCAPASSQRAGVMTSWTPTTLWWRPGLLLCSDDVLDSYYALNAASEKVTVSVIGRGCRESWENYSNYPETIHLCTQKGTDHQIWYMTWSSPLLILTQT